MIVPQPLLCPICGHGGTCKRVVAQTGPLLCSTSKVLANPMVKSSFFMVDPPTGPRVEHDVCQRYTSWKEQNNSPKALYCQSRFSGSRPQKTRRGPQNSARSRRF